MELISSHKLNFILFCLLFCLNGFWANTRTHSFTKDIPLKVQRLEGQKSVRPGFKTRVQH
jgi:hypothetical protein